MHVYERLSPAEIKLGTKRPEVHSLQAALGATGYYDGAFDGWAGPKTISAVETYQRQVLGEADRVVGKVTWTHLLRDAREQARWSPSFTRRIQTVIAFYETGTRRDAYEISTIIPDGAGVNYGVLQHNRHGSLEHLLKLAGRDDLKQLYQARSKFHVVPEIREWIGSADGIAAQDKYFSDIILKLARGIDGQLGDLSTMLHSEQSLVVYRERLALMLADCVVQNGGLFSPRRRPFWKTLTPDEAKHEKYRELYYGERWNKLLPSLPYQRLKEIYANVETGGKRRAETNRIALLRCLDQLVMPEEKLVLIAQWRARSSAPRWWTPAVESRRMTDATGNGRVNGTKLDLELDFGFPGDEMFDDREEDTMQDAVPYGR